MTAAQGALSSSFATSSVVKCHLANVWESINAMQIISYSTYMNVYLPANCLLFFETLIDIAEFDLVDTRPVQEALFPYLVGVAPQSEAQMPDHRKLSEIQETDPDSDEEETDILDKIGDLLLVLLMICILVPFIWAIGKLKRYPCCKKTHTKLYYKMYWNDLLRFVMETYLPILMVNYSRFKQPYIWEAPYIFSNLFTSAVFYAALAFPSFLTVYMLRHKHEWRSPKYRKSFNEILEFAQKRHNSPAFFFSVFCYRRALLVWLLVSFQSEP